MPNIILKKSDDPNYTYECLDGQHRLNVIRHYMTGEKINGNRIKWQKTVDGKITDIYYMRSKLRSTKVYMTEIEREKFNTYTLQLFFIQSPMTVSQTSIIFNRLQNGSPASNFDKTKNLNHRLATIVRDMKIDKFNKFEESKIGKLLIRLFNYDTEGHRSVMKDFFATIVRFYALIRTKGLDKISSFKHLNIIKDIENNSDRADISSVSNTDICNDLFVFTELIVSVFDNLNSSHPDANHEKNFLTKHTFFALADIYEHVIRRSDARSETFDGRTYMRRIIGHPNFTQHNATNCPLNQIEEDGKVVPASRYVELRDTLFSYADYTHEKHSGPADRPRNKNPGARDPHTAYHS